MIQINLLRISPDSKYLEFSVECPINYKFNKLFIKKYDAIPVNSTDDLWRDVSHLLQRTSTKEIMRISTEALSGYSIEPDSNGNMASTMYYVQFGVEWIEPNPGAPTLPIPTTPDVIGVASDVNKVYAILKDYILNLNGNCCTSTEDYQFLTRNYMFLYAHLEAMRLERFDDAEMFYDILKKEFVNCAYTRSAVNRNTDCNCR